MTLKQGKSPIGEPEKAHRSLWVNTWLPRISWGIAALMIAFAVLVLLQVTGVSALAASSGDKFIPADSAKTAPLPDYSTGAAVNALSRISNLSTVISDTSRETAAEYTIESGDSIFAISKSYDVKPETILWANYAILNDNPDLISVGDTLIIPPADGIYIKVKDGDTIDSLAAQYKSTPDKILYFPGNKMDVSNPKLEVGSYVMIPGGSREWQRTWLVPTYWRPSSGANKTITGQCEIADGGAYGSGAFVWPADSHMISGNDFWDGHLGIDIGAGLGANVYAADSGVVVYAGWISGGYGNMVMIDHGNGYHTVYGHLSSIQVRCGQSVYSGNVIGYAGSTGNSTGPHLHFEVRYFGAFINPHYVLP
ncbi:membrane proteins related to metalloendopeptidases [Longilinea arvoryzae]|uniref:Membrane proteins related to metalloendopeptidases n=2 Tax=Longilinea arvoryzae TaxID=360412 RepID=A0A0S7B9H2_9CHLR|nr:membrane proteins related to metalloendopeptidases [Longilinea arvoryzae]